MRLSLCAKTKAHLGRYRGETGWHFVDIEEGDHFTLWRYNEDRPYIRTWDIYKGNVVMGEPRKLVLKAATYMNQHEGEVSSSDEVFVLTLTDDGQPVELALFGFRVRLTLER